MLTLLSECHFWTMRDDVRIKSSDFGAFRYMRSREFQQQQSLDIVTLSKRDYIERRNGIAVLKTNNQRKGLSRLKDNLKKLEELLRAHKVVYSEWQDATQVLLLFSHGIIAHICVDIHTGDILRMVFEKYLLGKLASEQITDAFFTRSHIVLAYNTNQLTVVYLQKPNVRAQGPEKISNMEPRIFHIIIPGTSERKLARHLIVNDSNDLFVVWTKSSQNEVYPWRPTIRDQDRANIHVFKLKGIQMEPLAYCWSENDPLCVDFLRASESQLLILEQKISRKGEITAEICSYALNVNKMLRTALTSIAMGTQVCCYAFSPDQEKLFLGSIDRNICMHDLVRQTSKFLKNIDIIPTHCTWHCDSSLIMIANDRAQFQCYDLALTPITSQLQSEDVTPSNLLDLSHYFAQQPCLEHVNFSRKPDLCKLSQDYAQTDCFLLLRFEQGTLGCLRFFSGAGMRGDIHNSGLTADVIVDKYLALNQLEKAINLLLALNWDTYGAMCLISLHKIANHVFYRGELRQTRIELMAKALKTFTNSLSEQTKDEFSDQVFDLKRRFFFFLLRKGLYADAFEVAQDIEDYDLFMDLYNITKTNTNLLEFSSAAFSQAANILHEEDRANGNLSLIVGDYNSESVCSQSTCSDTLNNSNTPTLPDKTVKSYVAALPSMKSKIFNAEMIKINAPKPSDALPLQEVKRAPPPPPPTTTATSEIRSLKQISTASTLATLSIKSMPANSASTTTTRVWQQTSEQKANLLNAPSNPYTPSTAHNILPRASTQAPMPLSVKSNNVTHTTTTNVILPTKTYQQPKFYQHPLILGNIPPTAHVLQHEEQQQHQRRLFAKKPTASILSNSSHVLAHNGYSNNVSVATNGALNGSKEATEKSKNTAGGEKNKVKFSDTIQVAVVPGKPMPPKRNGYARPVSSRNLTNPKKELADSLPLCHPNDDYLKDFNPISTDNLQRPAQKNTTKQEHLSANSKSTATPPASIKVVHFGVV